jgi:glycosyltransferase involved in cell wall biosynthesis
MTEVIASEPLVSVIMNGYNCERYLKQAIDSVFLQSYLNWEIVFWDNGSTDATQSIATSYGPKLRYFRSEINSTLGAARNSVLKNVRGDFISFLDTDDYWLSDKLSLQVTALKEMDSVDFIYSNFYLLDQKTGRMIKGLTRQQPAGYVFGKFLQHYPINLQTVMIRKTALALVDHYFDDELTLTEEFDLFMRILYRANVYYIKSCTAVYRFHSEMSSIKNMEKYPSEAQLCLAKLLAIDSSIVDVYKDEIIVFRGKIAFWQARWHMFNGKSIEARRALKMYRFDSIKLFALYISTVSRSVWNFLLLVNTNVK